MKLAISAAAAACLMLPQVSSAGQPDQDPGFVVQAPTQIQAWAGSLSRELDQQLQRVSVPIHPLHRSTGIVAIGFSPGSSGTPAETVVLRSSGSRALDRAALRAVGRLDGMNPLPDGVSTSSKIRANIIFANSHDELDRYAIRLQREEATRLARAGAGREQIALTVGSRVTG